MFIRLLKDDHPHVKPLILTESDRNNGNDWQCRSMSFPVQKKNLAIWKVVKKAEFADFFFTNNSCMYKQDGHYLYLLMVSSLE